MEGLLTIQILVRAAVQISGQKNRSPIQWCGIEALVYEQNQQAPSFYEPAC